MKNYLKNMVFKPDYLVKYNEANGTYYGISKAPGMYKSINGKDFIVLGYAASKSHPNEPISVSIRITNHNPNDDYVTDNLINVYKLDAFGFGNRTLYTSKHDLFVYKDAQTAILAGKEMALYDEADRITDTCKDYLAPFTNYVQRVINNPLYRHIGEGLAELAKQEFEKHAKNFEPTYDKAKETVKETYDKAKKTVKTGVDKFFEDIQKSAEQPSVYKCENENCTFYRELNDVYAVTLKHRKNITSTYSVTIHNLVLGTCKCYYITQEMFHNIYEIINEQCDGRLKFNSIMDILADQVNNDMNSGKKTKPIQQVEFRKQDVVEEAPAKKSTLFTHKFKIGDKVRVNRNVRKTYIAYCLQIGTVVNITSRGTKTLYVVKFFNGISTTMHELYSNELDKVEEQPQQKIKKVGAFKVMTNNGAEYSFATTDKVDELGKKLAEHDKVLDNILDTLNRIDRNTNKKK